MDAAEAAGYRSEYATVDMLGRPLVRRALLALAPLLATDKAGQSVAHAILRPYAMARIAQNLDIPGQNGMAAARDLLESAGNGPSARERWEAMQARRARALGTSGNAHYGNPSEPSA